MKCRLSLSERNELAFKLKSNILAVEDPQKLEILSDERFQPHFVSSSVYAFEYFLDQFRERFSSTAVRTISYLIGWSRGALQRDEESRYLDRVVRMSTIIFVTELESNGMLQRDAAQWHENLVGRGIHVNSLDELTLLLYEIFYELANELSRDLAHKLK